MSRPSLGRCDLCQREARYALAGNAERFCEMHMRAYEWELRELASRSFHGGILKGYARSFENDEKVSLQEQVSEFMDVFLQTLNHDELADTMELVHREVERRRGRMFPEQHLRTNE